MSLSAPIRLPSANILSCSSMSCSLTCAASLNPRKRRHPRSIPLRKKFRFRRMPHREAKDRRQLPIAKHLLNRKRSHGGASAKTPRCRHTSGSRAGEHRNWKQRPKKEADNGYGRHRQEATTEGEYFCNSVWWWHPLASYICVVAPEIADHC